MDVNKENPAHLAAIVAQAPDVDPTPGGFHRHIFRRLVKIAFDIDDVPCLEGDPRALAPCAARVQGSRVARATEPPPHRCPVPPPREIEVRRGRHGGSLEQRNGHDGRGERAGAGGAGGDNTEGEADTDSMRGPKTDRARVCMHTWL